MEVASVQTSMYFMSTLESKIEGSAEELDKVLKGIHAVPNTKQIYA